MASAYIALLAGIQDGVQSDPVAVDLVGLEERQASIRSAP
jgi:hypothetical protein